VRKSTNIHNPHAAFILIGKTVSKLHSLVARCYGDKAGMRDKCRVEITDLLPK
jgi:hypothetical protein